MLRDRRWKLKYTPDDGNLAKLFYVPVLEEAERYDRLTGYFNAGALALAARGIEGLVRNNGHMRLVVGCTLAVPEIEAIEKGQQLRDLMERHMANIPLAPPDSSAFDALELLTWMVARGHLEVKVAVPCDSNNQPIPSEGIFHEKSGIIADRGGDKIAWNGSLNETASGWRFNWESINVYTSWGVEPERVVSEEANFARIWANRSKRVIALDVPDAVRRDLMRFMPKEDIPVRLKKKGKTPEKLPRELPKHQATDSEKTEELSDKRNRVWSFLQRAPSLSGGGELVGEATSAIVPWPHQVKAFERLYHKWPPKLLIADEVGLGKTIQAGMLLRQAWLAGRVKRILILAPKAVLKQWQIELREKFNLNWPIYDGHKLVWRRSPALRGKHERQVDQGEWHKEPVVIASSHLMRRRDRSESLLKDAETWDLVVLDEAHHARRRGAGSQQEKGPNALLRLMHGLKERTQGLILLTATPMQVHPIEVWDLLNLLELPPEWSAKAFMDFFDDIEQPNPSSEAVERMARLFQAVERRYGRVRMDGIPSLTELSRLKVRKVFRALRDGSSIPRRQLETAERQAAIKIVRANTPIRQLVSRHTRELLRRYFKAGLLSTPIANRRVEDRFLEMTLQERDLYEAVEDYIASTYNKAKKNERSAVGFVMTIYRRRLASSFSALKKTLRNHLEAIANTGHSLLTGLDEDAPDNEAVDEVLDADEVEKLERESLAVEEQAEIQDLLFKIDQLPPDSKFESLVRTLTELFQGDHRQVMVFTQYTDTMYFLREELIKKSGWRLMCFSGRGGEIPSSDGGWHQIGREDTKRRFRDGEADILLCTDAASEGLNFQFCGALINYDMPWNPMRVEQRIGRIDRLGQKHEIIRIVNLHYEGTVETDVYRALRSRIGLFESVIGRLQPILASLPQRISTAILSGTDRDVKDRENIVEDIERQAREAEGRGFDIDTVTEENLEMPERPSSTVTMDDLDRIITSAELMPPGIDIQPMGHREYGFLSPGISERLRVTTDPEFFEEHSESLELWSPGNPLFKPPEFLRSDEKPATGESLKDLLDR